MSKFVMGVCAVLAFLVMAMPIPAEAQRFRFTCIGMVHSFEGCFRMVGRTVRGEAIRIAPTRRAARIPWVRR